MAVLSVCTGVEVEVLEAPEVFANWEALDREREHAEAYSTDPDVWRGLARRYWEAGRDAMASRCYERARHYGGQEMADNSQDRILLERVFTATLDEWRGVSAETAVRYE